MKTKFDLLAVPADLWTGWYRPSGSRKWLMYAAEDTEALCCAELERNAPRGGDYLIRVPGLGDPNED